MSNDGRHKSDHMSGPPVRHADKLTPDAKFDERLSTGYCSHLATISPDGSPYVCPFLYVWLDVTHEGDLCARNMTSPRHVRIYMPRS
jgi:nitroimidazol reductase NimA-like FMN-containing flavoprotein (pyridoxamine 5'-phosphate oxidase superfamily)